MIVELEGDDRKPLERLFGDYPCMHGCIAAVIKDGAGKVFADSRENPSAALAVVDFQFLAGDPFHESVPMLFSLLHGREWVIAPTPEWQHVVSTSYQGRKEIYQREAFLAEQFDVNKLGGYISELPAGFELRKISLENVAKFAELSPALIASYASPEEFVDRGVEIGIHHKGRFVSGASSSPLGGGKLEFEVQTRKYFRRRGFARIVASALILHCLENGIEPCWDAANEPSSSLALQLGFSSTGKYDAFWLPPG